MSCLRYKDCCTLHVHWLDHTYESEEELKNTNKYHLFPKWYKSLLLVLNISSFTNIFSFKEKNHIIDFFNPKEK